MDFSGILPALQTGNVDVALAGITITDERKQAIDFSDGYYDSGFLLMVGVDSDIESTDDLAGKTLALKTGTSAAQYAQDNFTETTLRLFPNIDNAYLELQTGRVEAAMHDTPNVLFTSRRPAMVGSKPLASKCWHTNMALLSPRAASSSSRSMRHSPKSRMMAVTRKFTSSGLIPPHQQNNARRPALHGPPHSLISLHPLHLPD